ncbi:MAG: hypothetical protein ACR2JF_01550 [Iamia sp.]
MRYAIHRNDPTAIDAYRALAPVYDGADAGNYSLPPDVTAARHALAAAESFPDPEAPDVDTARAALVTAYIKAATSGAKPPTTAAPVTKAQTAAVDAAELRTALAAAVTRLGRERDSLVVRSAEQIVTDHLRPAHDKAVAAAEDAVAVIGATGADPIEVLTASEVLVAEGLRAARTALDTARRRYAAILTARGALVRAIGGPSVDVGGMFTWAVNGDEVTHRNTAAPPLGPTDPLGHFCWRITGPAKLWCPTVAEQDARHKAVHADDPRPNGPPAVGVCVACLSSSVGAVASVGHGRGS